MLCSLTSRGEPRTTPCGSEYILCDARDQLARYASLATDPKAIETVNREAGNANACAVALVTFFVNETHG